MSPIACRWRSALVMQIEDLMERNHDPAELLSDGHEPGAWYPRERRANPSPAEMVGLLMHRMDQCARKMEALDQRIAEFSAIQPELKQIVENRRALTIGRQAVAWIGGAIIGAWGAVEGGQHILNFLRGTLK